MTEEQKIAEKMRRTAVKEQQALTVQSDNVPANYLDPSTINSISSVKKDKTTFDKLIARTLLDIIMNGKDNKEKMAAIDRYQKLTQSSQLLLKSGSKTAAIETQSDGPTTLNIDLSSHVKTDEPMEDFQVKSRDLVAEKNAALFEDADFEVIEG